MCGGMDRVFADGLFADEVVLITGGGTGIGLVSATEMGSLGARIAICGRRPDPLEKAVAELDSKGIEAFGAPCDIREPEAIASYVDSVLERYGRIDVLINNAGGQFPTTAEALFALEGFEYRPTCVRFSPDGKSLAATDEHIGSGREYVGALRVFDLASKLLLFVNAIKDGQFQIWAIDHVDQGIEILTGVSAGVRNEEGEFPEGTINYLVDQKLDDLSKGMKEYESSGDDENSKSDGEAEQQPPQTED